MALLHRLHPLLHGALVVVAIVAMAMVIMVVAVRAMQEVISSRQGDAMTVYDGNEAKVCVCVAKALSCGLHLLLHGVLVVVATMAMAIAIMVVAVRATQEVTLSRWGSAMTVCDGNEKACICGQQCWH